ncbi:unnamed protein product, partial [Amoebophrya sp. A25]
RHEQHADSRGTHDHHDHHFYSPDEAFAALGGFDSALFGEHEHEVDVSWSTILANEVADTVTGVGNGLVSIGLLTEEELSYMIDIGEGVTGVSVSMLQKPSREGSYGNSSKQSGEESFLDMDLATRTSLALSKA